LACRLASGHGVQFETDIAEGLPDLACDPVALRQVLINLITVVVPRASGGLVRLTVQPLGWEVLLRLQCAAYPSGPKPALGDETERLNIAQDLARLSGGRLALDVDARAFDATAIYPAVEQLPVLVVDDNADTLELLQRYVAGSRYYLTTTRDPEAALALAEEHAPQIIVLDVMMPGVDGWTVLAQLQQRPATSHIPVVVCTVLPQKDLALFLGASGFLRKPLTRQEFLAALDQQAVRLVAESH
ncbi:MAG: response regulator, partial [Anaerolineales bacterium]|nr:response regulator [Anaerolineales bacterium]